MTAKKKTPPQAYDIAATYVTSGAVTLLAAFTAVFRLNVLFQPEGLLYTLPVDAVPSTITLTVDGAFVDVEGIAETVSVLATSVNALSTVAAATSIVLVALMWAGLAVVLGVAARQLSTGRPFGRPALHALTWGSYGLLGATLALMMLDRFAANGVAAAVSPDIEVPFSFVSLSPYIGWWAVAFGLGVWSLVMGRGAKLEKDTDGLV